MTSSRRVFEMLIETNSDHFWFFDEVLNTMAMGVIDWYAPPPRRSGVGRHLRYPRLRGAQGRDGQAPQTGHPRVCGHRSSVRGGVCCRGSSSRCPWTWPLRLSWLAAPDVQAWAGLSPGHHDLPGVWTWGWGPVHPGGRITYQGMRMVLSQWETPPRTLSWPYSINWQLNIFFYLCILFISKSWYDVWLAVTPFVVTIGLQIMIVFL